MASTKRDYSACVRVGGNMRAGYDLRDAFERRHCPEALSGCWLWTGSLDAAGYGQFMFAGKMRKGHRVSLELHVGPPPDDRRNALHRCGNKACVSPHHLYWGTARENSEDSRRDGTLVMGEAHPVAKLTSERVALARASARTSADLAAEWGVTPTTVDSARRGLSWKHVTVAPRAARRRA